jgi:Uma2 family endonuclease
MEPTVVDVIPEMYDLITEDDTPVDNLLSEKQQRLLTEPLYSAWAGQRAGRPFLAAANVGIFYQIHTPAIVPDMLLSLDVRAADDLSLKENRSYFLWVFGKPPDLALEIVSNKEGEEDSRKKHLYAQIRINYYVIYDPSQQLMSDVLTVYRLRDFGYERQETAQLPLLKLGLTLWDGPFEDTPGTWLRWTDEHGVLIPTGKERADQAEHLLAAERQRTEQERQRADQERQRAERLAALLRQAGMDPEQA